MKRQRFGECNFLPQTFAQHILGVKTRAQSWSAKIWMVHVFPSGFEGYLWEDTICQICTFGLCKPLAHFNTFHSEQVNILCIDNLTTAAICCIAQSSQRTSRAAQLQKGYISLVVSCKPTKKTLGLLATHAHKHHLPSSWTPLGPYWPESKRI